MKSRACLVVSLLLMAGCVLEDTPVNQPDGSVEAGLCGFCPAETPACNEAAQMCVQCTAQNVTACVDDTPACDLDAFECVECVASSDCNEPMAARCDTELRTCVGCESASDCEGVAGLPVCNAGTCVECVPDTEDTDCGGNSCNPATFRCTGTLLASRDTCETCVSDSECQNPGNRCVAMEYQGAPHPDAQTGFCLKTTEGGCERPYSITLQARMSFSGGLLEDYCGINEQLATCEAVRALLNDDRCDGGTDEECPQPSGLCRQVGSLANRCTYLCGLPAQCPADAPADTCGSSGSGGDDYCGG